MVELRTLAYFVTSCRATSFARAADELDIAVSTLSTTLKALGEELGVTLFRRSNNTLYPTEAARTLMRAAEPLLVAETFARRHVAASAETRLRHLVVNVHLTFTIGGVSKALRLAIDRMAVERPDTFVDPQWKDERDFPHVTTIADDWSGLDRSQVTIALSDAAQRKTRHEIVVLSDPWVFALRLPASTRKAPGAAELLSGRIVVPMLAAPLVEQADRYFSRHKITGVRFLNDHPGDLPRTLDDYADAALFVPRSLMSPRLGLSNVVLVDPEHGLTMELVARSAEPNPMTNLFVRHLKRALAAERPGRPERPVISLRQIHYFNLIHRVRRVSAAARGANISQPALSEQLHKLEKSVGGALFERKGDGVVPTTKGDRFARFATMIEAGSRRLSASDHSATLAQGRRIVVGILPSVNQHGFLVNRIADAAVEIRARYPALKLVFQEAPNGTLQDWVIRGLVGVAVVETALPHMPRLPLGSSEGLAAIAHRSHRLLPGGPVRLADLIRLKLALPTNRFGLRQLLENAAVERDLKIQPVMEIDALPMAVSLLARLPVCTVLPASAVAREIESGDLVAHPIIEPTIARRLYVIYSGERTLSEPERGLVNILRRRLSESQAADQDGADQRRCRD
ncbi:LysR family transcriptional regulator [Bradyrhizobium jicamae]|uniref:LysR family transcriptional regulator n=1 Tax=Bradyrhizobium jicamae TaxID=280332 RepID=UPI001BA85845|nr:LysR family transcriptional regulator [Bradyrhizobium jicamae]MBR0932698.1 LysR family transcriptional regulator [Bradyrhizobium jicamae]